MHQNQENKYKTGAFVVANSNPTQRLVVRRYAEQIYYCRPEQTPDGQDEVYFERELSPVNRTRTAEQVWQSQQTE